MFDDVVEHCGEGAHKYLPACFPAFMDGVTEVCHKTPGAAVTLTQTVPVAWVDSRFPPEMDDSFERRRELLRVTPYTNTPAWQTLPLFNLQETSPMLQMASVYGLQQTAKHAPVFFLPRAEEVRGPVRKAMYRCDTEIAAV